ncbi:MAG: hypothetical protein FWE22_07585 [Firmicutes bacterium]|nr:hypothetical protein [Bacillota bacterium]
MKTKIIRLLTVILSLMMAMGVLAGCNLFEHNERREMMQVVATINPIYNPNNPDGFRSEPHNIYMWQLMQMIGQQGGFHPDMTREDRDTVIDSMIEQLVIRQLILIDIDRMLYEGEIVWRAGHAREEDELGRAVRDENGNFVYLYDEDGNPIYDYTDANRVRQLVYGAIDQTLESIRVDVLSDFNIGVPDVAPPPPDTHPTTFPVRPPLPEHEIEEEELREEEPWTPDRARWPGYFMTVQADISFENQVMERFLSLLRNRTDEDNLEVTDADRELFNYDNALINGIISGNNIPEIYGLPLNPGHSNLYPIMFNPVWGYGSQHGHIVNSAENSLHMVYVLLGRQAVEQVRIERLQERIVGNVEVQENHIRNHFNNLQRQQQQQFRNNWAAYAAAMRGGETVLYHPVIEDNNQRFFFVKHILLPFSPSQTQELNAFRQTPAGRDPRAVENFRDNVLVPQIRVPDRVNGESDYSVEFNATQVFNFVRSEMAQVGGNVMAAERRFTDLIYRFNTDPGAFGNNRGYIEVSELLPHESETYMQEFADGARELNRYFSPGQVLPRKVITDFGVHIMYLASVVHPGTQVTLDSFETPGQISRVRENIENELREILEGGEFTRWQNQRIVYFTQTRTDTYETFPRAWRRLSRGRF